MNAPLRVAVVGVNRGQSFAHSAALLSDQIRLTALCDIRAQALQPWRDNAEIRLYNDYQQVLEDPDIDAVCIATPIKLHARQAIAALNAGKHVLSEVSAAWTLDECRDLIEAVQGSGLTYMMAENCCFMRPVMMVQEMVRRGIFGDLMHAEGSYIHAIPELLFDEGDELTWRGCLCRDELCDIYPTHSLGPVCKWLGVGESDQLKSLACWQSGSHAVADYVRRTKGEHHPLADSSKWRLPDTVHLSLQTAHGRLIHHRLDIVSPRPHNMNHYALQGTRAAVNFNVTPSLEPLVWIEGRSPTRGDGVPLSWEPLYQYADEFEHPLWREWGDEARKTGHGGADYFAIREFAAAIRESRPPTVDVYDAVTWSSVTPLSALSLQNGNAPVEVPNWKSQN